MGEQMLISTFGNADSASLGLGALLGIFAEIGIEMIVFYVVLLVLTIIAMWRIFTKAGEAGWKSLIPLYNVYILFKIAGRNFWKYLGIAVLLGVVDGIIGSVTNSILAIVLSVVMIILAVWIIIEVVKVNHGLSIKFGHGAGFTVGLIFLNTIFMLILGLGSSQYQGSTSKE